MFMSSFTLKFKISHYVKFTCPSIFSFLACKCLCFCRTWFCSLCCHNCRLFCE
ncbi:hypothetical protein Hanom_Chr03g00267601 [Helianthus anomalus]